MMERIAFGRRYTRYQARKRIRAYRAKRMRRGPLVRRLLAVRRSQVGGERKFFDTTKALTVATTGGVIYSDTLVAMAIGTGESNRIGRKIQLKGIYMRGSIQLNNQTVPGSTADRVRVILYWDKQTNKAAAAVTDLLKTANVDSFRNLNNSGRFMFLHDKTYALSSQSGGPLSTTTTNYGEKRVNLTVSKNVSITIEFVADTPSVADLASNNIGVMCISQDGLVTIGYTARIRYTDN